MNVGSVRMKLIIKDAIRTLDGVEDLTLIQYNGEYHG